MAFYKSARIRKASELKSGYSMVAWNGKDSYATLYWRGAKRFVVAVEKHREDATIREVSDSRHWLYADALQAWKEAVDTL